MRIRAWMFVSCLMLLTIHLVGCQENFPEPTITGQVDFFVSSEPMLTTNSYVAGHSVQGRDINCVVHGYGQDVVMFIASIHGSERAGTPLCEYFSEYLDRNPELFKGKKIVILPMVNPDGFSRKQRYNANAVDLNRNFPAENRVNNQTNGYGSLSEPESRTIERLIDLYKPNRIITFHEAMNCVDYDGPAQELAQAMASRCGIPCKKVGARPGSLGSYAGETLGIPIITVEFPASVRGVDGHTLWQEYGQMLIAAVEYKS